jgi:hypothetical protein
MLRENTQGSENLKAELEGKITILVLENDKLAKVLESVTKDSSQHQDALRKLASA